MAEDRGVIGTNMPLIVSTMVLLLTILGGFWSLADPRGELKSIRDSYLTVREHEEFVHRFNKDITRIETENRLQEEHFQTLLNARQSKDAADQATIRLEKRIDDLVTELRALRQYTQMHIDRDSDRFSKGGDNGNCNTGRAK
jgi:hypothetical protein